MWSLSLFGICGANARVRVCDPPNIIKLEHFQRHLRTVYLSPGQDNIAVSQSLVAAQACLTPGNLYQVTTVNLDNSLSSPHAG